MIYEHGISFLDRKSADHYLATRQEVAAKYPGINLDINDRWENGVDHHPRSIELMDKIAELDTYFMSDMFCWKTGGDGDNGEALMFLMDIIFEYEDLGNRNA